MDEKNLLDKLNSLVQSKTDPETGKSKSWIAAIVIFFVVLIAIFVFAYISTRQSRELAKLAHEKNKLEVEKENNEVKAKASVNDMERAKLQVEIEKAEKDLAAINKKLDDVTKARDKDKQSISSIRGWDNL